MARRKSIPKMTRHKASGRAVVRLNGTNHYIGPRGSEQGGSKLALHMAQLRYRGGLAPARPGHAPTVKELADAYLAWASTWYVKHGKPTGQLERVQRSVGVAVKLYGDTRADKFGPI